jgi:hypothetical protein
VGAASLAASSLYFLAPGYVPARVGVGIDLALAAGATLTYAWLGFTQAPLDGASGTVHRLGNALFALVAGALLAIAARTVRRTRGGEAG